MKQFLLQGTILTITCHAVAFAVGGSILLRDFPLAPLSVVSRKTHGGGGTFDIDLPLSGSPGIECRTDGGLIRDYTIVLTFSGNVTVTGDPQAQVTSGIGMIGSGGVGNGGVVTIEGNIVTIPLTNVANAQIINVTLFGVNGVGNIVVPMAVLAGDVNANGVVNASDLAHTKLLVGEPIDLTTFRCDVSTNGSINATDVTFIKSKVGTGLP